MAIVLGHVAGTVGTSLINSHSGVATPPAVISTIFAGPEPPPPPPLHPWKMIDAPTTIVSAAQPARLNFIVEPRALEARVARRGYARPRTLFTFVVRTASAYRGCPPKLKCNVLGPPGRLKSRRVHTRSWAVGSRSEIDANAVNRRQNRRCWGRRRGGIRDFDDEPDERIAVQLVDVRGRDGASPGRHGLDR